MTESPRAVAVHAIHGNSFHYATKEKDEVNARKFMATGRCLNIEGTQWHVKNGEKRTTSFRNVSFKCVCV